ncbi:OmpA family protein [Rheinheimera maricola]|uniref:OmpA family protein n=1 Tax=Rheinheimera maricola TaxID=2793282 RepID=A0ABS7X9L3_9GAMM|nr:OmpA family protein [Rheinheimera maricola]MBZ9611864.1 OmpA family protein [Rheinheimera maricola]
MRTLSLVAAAIAAMLSVGCASTSGNETAANPAVVNAETAKPQTLLLARLQPVAGVVTSEHDSGIKVTFPGSAAFSHDGAHINEPLQQQLGAVAQILKNTPFNKLTVLGHTDSSGQLVYNNNLSQQRAEQVKEFLQQQGLNAEQLEAQGRGPAEPIADNTSLQGKAANRRIEIMLSF